MKKLSENQILEIISRYQSGETPSNISKDFGIYPNSILRILRKRKIERNQLEKVSKDNIEYIINQYENLISINEISKDLDLCESTISRILKKNNISLRPASELRRKYTINQNYFENIDSEDKAYYLGFLYADANLTKNETKRYCIKITLHSQDRDLVDNLSNIIYGFNNVRPFFKSNIETEYSTLNIYSKKMHSDLQKLGCFPCKSHIINFNENIVSNNLIRHFIRGYFDGDGCICLKNISRPVIDITSNKNFIIQLKEYLEKLLNITFNKIFNKSENTSNIQLTSYKNIKIFLDYLYKDCNFFLKRKMSYYNDFNNLIEFKRQNKINKISDFSNYGTSYIPSYKGNIINSDFLKTISNEEKVEIADYLISFYKENKFPYPILNNNELIKDFNILKKFDPKSINEDKYLKIFNMSGLSIFRHFSPHFFEVKSGIENHKPSMIEAFNNDYLLKKVIINRLNQNYSLTGSMLRQGLCNSNVAFKASIFFPTIAKFIYNKFCKENDIIYDYSMGFGQRLIAALSLPFKVKYVGVDPLLKSVESNKNIFNFLNESIPSLNKEMDLICDCSENLNINYLNKIDLAFSSPPYFNQEIYEDNKNQAYYNNDYKSFLNWWRKTVENINLLLKQNGYFIVNIKDKINNFNLSEDMNNIIKEYDFELYDTYYIQLSKNISFRRNCHKYEPIFIYKKTN